MGMQPPEQPSMTFYVTDHEKVELNPNNSRAVVHGIGATALFGSGEVYSNEQFDHVAVDTDEEDARGKTRKLLLYRNQIPDFDEIVMFMSQNGYPVQIGAEAEEVSPEVQLGFFQQLEQETDALDDELRSLTV